MSAVPKPSSSDRRTPEGRIGAWVSAARRHPTKAREEYRLAWYVAAAKAAAVRCQTTRPGHDESPRP